MKNIDKFIREFENMSKEDLVKSVKMFCPNLVSSTLWLMDIKSLAAMVASNMLIEELDKQKENQRELIRYYRHQLESDKAEQEKSILENLMDLTVKYENLFAKAMQEYFKLRGEEEVENEKRIQEILEKHRKHMTEELEKQIRKEREEREKEAKKQKEAQDRGVQCSDDNLPEI